MLQNIHTISCVCCPQIIIAAVLIINIKEYNCKMFQPFVYVLAICLSFINSPIVIWFIPSWEMPKIDLTKGRDPNLLFTHAMVGDSVVTWYKLIPLQMILL